jgi:hypothetical protein
VAIPFWLNGFIPKLNLVLVLVFLPALFIAGSLLAKIRDLGLTLIRVERLS